MAVAASGGRDSTALLHCTSRHARSLGIEVLALHVHHGLADEADAWQRHVQRQGQRWRRAGLPLSVLVHRLTASPPAGASVEAWAREERYMALAHMARAGGADVVLLAHHQQDQAETFLLQALRGGGPRGLASMPVWMERHGIRFERPWLQHPRAAIEHYLSRHRLSWIDDPSNGQERFARSALRSKVWPALKAAFPAAERTMASSAARAAEAAHCLEALASIDLSQSQSDPTVIRVDKICELTAPRMANLLRFSLPPLMQGQPVPQSLVERLVAELPELKRGRWPAPGGELRLHDGALRYCPLASDQALGRPPLDVDLSMAGTQRLPNSWGQMVVRRVAHGGVAPMLLANSTLRQRSGGEQFQSRADSPPRSLKKQFQSCRIPAWAREGPLVFAGDRLLFVPGLGMDARVMADEGQAQFDLSWEPLERR